ncbi:unnamed protein product, partial [Ectocarpus sp. 12 AP-2014]
DRRRTCLSPEDNDNSDSTRQRKRSNRCDITKNMWIFGDGVVSVKRFIMKFVRGVVRVVCEGETVNWPFVARLTGRFSAGERPGRCCRSLPRSMSRHTFGARKDRITAVAQAGGEWVRQHG